MAESSKDEMIVGPCDAVVYLKNGISTTMRYRILLSMDSRFMVLKDDNGQFVARFDIVTVTDNTMVDFEAFYVDYCRNQSWDTLFKNPYLCFRRRPIHDSRAKCFLRSIVLSDEFTPEFIIEFDIGYERDLVSNFFLGLSHRKHYVTVQIKKDSDNYYCIVGSKATTDNLVAILRLEDRRYLPDYLWVLCSQLKKGRLRECDINNISRKRNPLLVPGCLGLRCIHCGGLENGNYFPTKRGHLYGCAMRFEKHLHACIKCPPKIKQLVAQLKQLHKNHEHETLQKVKIHFFNELWDRIQNPELEGDDFAKIEESISDLERSYRCFSATSSIENHKVSLVRSPAVIEDLEETAESTAARKVDDLMNMAIVDPLTEYLNFANVGQISPSTDALRSSDVTFSSNTKLRTVSLNNEVQFTWDHRSLTDLEQFLQLNPDMIDCLDVLLY
mmetsp:Transcript_15028/g.28285  ORF Transcript_15028/g.28285 Transcript_15028/m.28285 type:complete len:443 (-) Transcript_15028:2451-3779(-)